MSLCGTASGSGKEKGDMAKEVHSWKVSTGDGVVTFTKGEHAIETTFNAKDESAADLAYEHALAQAYEIDNPKHDLAGKSVDEQWRTIRAWARKGD
jgi:hypothetical protein